jgi:ribonuclease HI
LKIKIFTDGSAKGNPGPGGFGVILNFADKTKEISQGFRFTTNNRMELLAVIVGLESLKTNQYPVEIYSDSKYVVDAITKGWVFNWKKNGFKGKKNSDLWLKYLSLHEKFKVTYIWIKGHAGHPENERCDFLAVSAAESSHQLIDEVFERNNDSDKLF